MTSWLNRNSTPEGLCNVLDGEGLEVGRFDQSIRLESFSPSSSRSPEVSPRGSNSERVGLSLKCE